MNLYLILNTFFLILIMLISMYNAVCGSKILKKYDFSRNQFLKSFLKHTLFCSVVNIIHMPAAIYIIHIFQLPELICMIYNIFFTSYSLSIMHFYDFMFVSTDDVGRKINRYVNKIKIDKNNFHPDSESSINAINCK